MNRRYQATIEVTFDFACVPWGRRLRLALDVLRGASPRITLPGKVAFPGAPRMDGHVDTITLETSFSVDGQKSN